MERKNFSKSCPLGHVNSYVGTLEGLVQPFNLRKRALHLNGERAGSDRWVVHSPAFSERVGNLAHARPRPDGLDN